jgi:type IV pilus assembly protein PilW
LLQGGAAVPIAGGIVQLQAQYGKDKNNDGIVNELTEWETTPPASATEWALVRALRLVVVARSAQAERPKDPVTGQIITGACNTTTVAPPASIPIDLTADPDWQCYRYRVFETVVPLRNQIWAPT